MSSRLGIISDTHGLLRSEAVRHLMGSDMIVHAGDIGSAQVLEELQSIAPTVSVRGNMDKGDWAESIAPTDIFEVDGRLIYVIHNLSDIDLDPASAGIDVVIFGHSHQPESRTTNGILYFNPGSAGPKRFKKPVSIGRILIQGKVLDSRIIMLAE